MVSPETSALLGAIAELITHAQAHPTDNDGIAKRRKARASAELAWVAAGSPDKPAGSAKPALPQAPTSPLSGSRKNSDREDAKDWTPVRVLLDVISLTEGGAAKCTDGSTVSHAPVKLLWEPGTREPVSDLSAGASLEVDVPRWLADEKGWA